MNRWSRDQGLSPDWFCSRLGGRRLLQFVQVSDLYANWGLLELVGDAGPWLFAPLLELVDLTGQLLAYEALCRRGAGGCFALLPSPELLQLLVGQHLLQKSLSLQDLAHFRQQLELHVLGLGLLGP